MAQADSIPTTDSTWWGFRFGQRLLDRFEPYLGWLVLLGCMAVTIFPAAGLRMIGRRGVPIGQVDLELIGPIAVFAAWLVLGWRRPRLDAKRTRWYVTLLQNLLALLLLLIIGFFVVSQVVQQWIPGPVALGQAAWRNEWSLLDDRVSADFGRFINRYALWWTGVRAGGAAQDNLVLAGLLGMGFWLLGGLTAWLARRVQRGLIAALPVLWLLAFMLLYTTRGRLVMVSALAAALFLHLVLDQWTLRRRWERRGLDFSPQILWERLWAVAAISVLLLALAAVTPSIGSNRVAWWYYTRIEPLNQQVEAATKRLFPDVRAGGGIFGYGVAGGLPNEFLVTSSDTPRDDEVMRVRTNESAGDYGMPDAPPPGHYMRSGTFSDYDGRGWDNPENLRYVEARAGEPWIESVGSGRKTLTQNVFLSFNSRVLYAAGEPIEPSVGYRAALRGPGDLVTISAPARSYTVLSQAPAVGDAQLAAAPGFDADRPLPAGLEIHLALPDTVTPRTRDLAAELTAGQSGAFAKAQAIESYLRGFEYDLDVPLPPPEIVDITDYFLFELQRGYCDYYATAFVTLARLAGLPTRFATGFAVGAWDPRDRTFVITEAEAHSWPEVYFPDFGWIPFEPTAGRPALVRPESTNFAAGVITPRVTPVPDEAPATDFAWSPQMLVWLLPLGLLLWATIAFVRRLRLRREDPWAATLRWGARAGYPMGDEQTTLEYGRALGDHILTEAVNAPDTGRMAAREVGALSRDVTAARYGLTEARTQALDRAVERWRVLREYLRLIR